MIQFTFTEEKGYGCCSATSSEDRTALDAARGASEVYNNGNNNTTFLDNQRRSRHRDGQWQCDYY